MVDRNGKRRSRAQLIGETGEDIFKTWGTKHRLSATKPPIDYGIDFLCHVFRGNKAGSQLLSGAVLAVQVRSTSAKSGKQRIKLNRDDASAALAADVPYLLVGVDIRKNRVYFRFLDQPLMTRLQTFLSGSKKTLSWPLEKMERDDAIFFRQLDDVTTPGHQHRLRWSRARLELAAIAPGSTVSSVQLDDSGVAHVRMPLITAAFDVPSDVQHEAAQMVFARGELPTDAQRFPPHAAVAALADLVNGAVILEGAIEQTRSLSVQAPGGNPVTIPVSFRSIGDEMGFVLQCGLYLTFSGARRKGRQFVHQFRHGIGVGDVKPLFQIPEEVEFLKSLCAGASIWSGAGDKIPVDRWGQLELLGPGIQRIAKVFSDYALPIDGLTFKEAVAESFQIGTHVAEVFASGGELKDVMPPFVIEEPRHGGAVNDNRWHPCRYEIPVALNLHKSGLTIWSSGVGSAYLSDGDEICGFRAERQTAWHFEGRAEPFPDLERPELWLFADWPGIPLAEVGAHSVAYRGTPLPLAGRISLVGTDDSPDDQNI